MLADDSWKKFNFKEYNPSSKGAEV